MAKRRNNHENFRRRSEPADDTKLLKTLKKSWDSKYRLNKQQPEEEPKHTGTCLHWDTARGYGFLQDLKIDRRVFVHISNIIGPVGSQPLRPGQRCTFDVRETDKGLMAINVTVEVASEEAKKHS